MTQENIKALKRNKSSKKQHDKLNARGNKRKSNDRNRQMVLRRARTVLNYKSNKDLYSMSAEVQQLPFTTCVLACHSQKLFL